MDTFESRQAGGLGRRSMLLAATTAAVVASVVEYAQAQAQTPADPLASWNEGPAKQAIIDFIRDTVDPSSKNFARYGWSNRSIPSWCIAWIGCLHWSRK